MSQNDLVNKESLFKIKNEKRDGKENENDTYGC